MRSDLVGQRGRETDDAELGADVDDLAGDRDEAGQRGDVDDVAAAAGDHVRQCELAAGDHAVEIDLRGTLIWGSALSDSAPPWSVRWHIG